MAYVTIACNFNEQVCTELTGKDWLVDLNFATVESFNSFMKNHFNPEIWELKNKNKILISGIHYKEYLINK